MMSSTFTPRPTLSLMALAGSLLACVGLLGAASAGAVESTAPTLYVAPTGSDTAAGTSSAPLRTITAAVSRTPSNGVVIVRSGSYHESLVLAGKTDVTIEAESGSTVWLDGSRVVSNWTQSGSAWVATGWTTQFDSSPTFTWGAADSTSASWQFVNPSYPMAAHPDQVWIDDVAQKQVGSRSEVGPGSFYVDYDKSQLILGSSPAGHEVRASDLAKAISIRDQGATISGINVRKFAPSVPTQGAVTVERPDVTLKDLKITDNATTGLQVGGPGARLSNLKLARNGMAGLRGTHADGLRIDQVVSVWNNLERFNSSPSAGGAKLVRTNTITVTGSRFSHNFGTGLWFDESAYNVRVFGSRITDNTANGLSLEISGTVKVANNVITDNDGNGMKINDTDKVDVWNNTLIGNGRTIAIVQDWRDVNLGNSYRNWSLPLTLRSEYVTLRNNILASPNSSADCLVCVQDYTHRFSGAQLKTSTDGNVYQRPSLTQPQWLMVWSRGAGDPARYDTITAIRTATGQEQQGRVLTGTAALTADEAPTSAVDSLVSSSAYAAPDWLASAANVVVGAKHLGAWWS